MEDTDEDFFDKLVDDVDDQFKVTSSSSTKGTVIDSNEAKSNSSINNSRNALKESEKVVTEDDKKPSSTISSRLIDESTSNQVNPGQSSVSSSSFAFQSVNEEPNNAIRMEEQFNSAEAQYHGTEGASGIKEVQWSAFTSDPLHNTSNAFGSYSDFFTEFGDNSVHQLKQDNFINNEANSYNNYSQQFQEGQSNTTSGRQSTENQDLNTSQYWENLYPGWKYDTNTQQWYQVEETYDQTTNTQAVDTLSFASDWTASSVKTEVAYLNQATQSLMADKGTTESATSWSPVSQTTEGPSNNGYPSHMYFDPQYPGWYYDMNIQEWRSLDSYNSQVDQFSSNSYYGNEQQKGSSGYQNVQNQYNSSNFPVDNQQQSYDYGNFSQSQSQSTTMEQNEMMDYRKGYESQNQNQLTYSHESGHHKSYGSTRSSAGQPPHALVTFGFGGKLIVMKDTSGTINTSYGGQDSSTRSISVLNMAELVTGGADVANSGTRICAYFHTLCRQSFPGPLAGGNVGGKELNRWIDERITQSQPTTTNYKKDQVLKLLLSLLKIASQHYGKLRSPFGTDTTSKENDAPDVAVARLFASAKRDSTKYGDYGAFPNCLQQLPSEGQIRATAAEVQTLLIYGRKVEALQRAQEGQLWGLALVLSAQLGDQFYMDCVRKMALHQLVAGSPLRTLCLLIAGQPADVFSTDSTTDSGNNVNTFQQPAQGVIGGDGMLDDWEENLAMITANRTKDDELVLIHLGDCLWKETSNIIAAHICYLVAEANFEPYSDSARLCLIGADHWKHPRTYACPEAIQRTEVYEYSKLLGNSQFTLLPFQPYKIIYANMLAEVGRVSDSLKYCQVISKSLKTGRAPEVETWRQMVSSLEDRIKTYQQGGFSTNLAPGKLVGKLLNLFDSTAHRVVGGLPPPVPSTSGSVPQNEHHQQPPWPRVSSSQSTMAMSSLVPSASMEPITQKSAENNRRIMHNRSVSEPDFGRSPRQDQVDSSKESPTDSQSKSSLTSRFGRFGFGSQLFQKTFSLVLKPRQDKQAKLGETNKFYYDDKLKRWVEEGVDPPAEEAALAPPPTMASFQNGTPDYAAKTTAKSDGSLANGGLDFSTGTTTTTGRSSGIPPIPASSSGQFSARGRMGVRSRYVDTFNQGGGNQPTKSFQSPSATPIKPTTKSNPKFFVPMAVPSSQQPSDTFPDNTTYQKHTQIDENQSPPFQPPTYQSSMQRFGSMDDLGKGGAGVPVFPSNTCSPRSRRTASWGGSMDERFLVSNCNNQRRQNGNGEVLGVNRGMQSNNGDGFMSMSDDLHEVQL